MFRYRLFLIVCVTLLLAVLPVGQVESMAVTGTFQDFDVSETGTPYFEGIHVVGLPTQGPQLINGGPTDTGKLMRLAFAAAPIPTHNSIAFDRTDQGTFDQIVADFDFRMSPGIGRADGFGFALLNTSNYDITGAVAPQNVAEEPNFVGSLGVGFDIYQSGPPTEISNNHLSIHFNGTLVQEFDVTPALDMAVGEWVHARIIMRPGGGYSDVTVILTQCGSPSSTVVNQFEVTGFTPYEGRAYFAARSGGESANHDIDNVRVNFVGLEQSIIAFSAGCYSVVETDGVQLLTVDRLGDVSESATVNYATANLSAMALSDYTATSDTLTFNAGETTKTLSVPILDDSDTEPDENFLVSLSNPANGTLIGGPAVAKVTIIDNESAQEEGRWSEVISSQVIPIHLHLLPTGQVMYWDRHNDLYGWDGNPHLWDPTTGMITMAAMPAYDIFCSGHSFMADGRLLVTGGHIVDGVGEDKASIYDPFTDSWTSLPVMNAGRWYPSNVTLANGDTLVLAGTSPQINRLPQIWQAVNDNWRDLNDALMGDYPDYADYYPFLYLAPNGKVFDAGPQQMARYLDTSGTGTWTDVAESELEYRDYGSSVMYDDGKVLIVGGNPRGDTFIPTASAEVINLNDADPEWRSVAPMHYGRRHLNATLLPDGKVLVTGGSSAAGFDNSSGAVLAAEIWDPLTETWTEMASQTRYRGYHSTALLLPDGRVLVGGGGHPNPASGAEYNFEIYSPPYLFQGARPTITNVPAHVDYGQELSIQTPDVATISQVTLVRLSSVTHAFNQNQRFKRLVFTVDSGNLTATIPADPNLLPPGHYMLFILNGDGTPSVATIIRIGGNAAPIITESNPQTVIMSEDGSPTPFNLILHATDANNDPLTWSISSPASHGIAAVGGTGASKVIAYSPTANYNGSDSFDVLVSDGILTDTITVNVTIATAHTFKSIGAQDGWTLESSETSNKGGTMNNTATVLYVGDNAQDKQYRSILSFNTVGLPDGNVTIMSVKLRIKVQGFVGGNMFTPVKTHGNLLVDNRDPYFGSNANLVVSDFQAAASKSSVGVLGSVPGTGWYTVTLKSTAYEFINRFGKTQFRLRFQKDDNDDLGADYLKIYSGDAPAASRPQLIVEYYIP